MSEAMAKVGDIELCYETFGDPDDPALLLVMGLATQMLGWHEDFCASLAGRGYFVIRFDNRDIGRSSAMQGRPPRMRQLMRRSRAAAAYTLEDMAADGVGLLDHLGVERAHVVGASMGGMIAQTVAARYPERTLSLVSIMSNTGALWSGQPAMRMYPMLLRPRPRDRAGFIEASVQTYSQIGSKAFPRDEEELRRVAGQSFDRGHDPASAGRQLAAILASGDRTPLLRKITAPTLVIHGTADQLVRPSGGRATARAIPGARLLLIDGMAHDLPRQVWPQITDAIDENARRAGDGAVAGAAGARDAA